MSFTRIDRPFSAVVLAAVSIGLVAARPFAEGPPSGHSGGFGEPTCAACHFGGVENPVDGLFDVVGLPEAALPDSTYLLEIVLKFPAMKRSGFQLTSRTEDGLQAGSFAPTDDRTAIDRDGVQYLVQTEAGSMPAERGSMRWTVRWTAPAAPGTVQFHGAANAANGDDLPIGDTVMARGWTVDVRAR